jgi:hypothetical protein
MVMTSLVPDAMAHRLSAGHVARNSTSAEFAIIFGYIIPLLYSRTLVGVAKKVRDVSSQPAKKSRVAMVVSVQVWGRLPSRYVAALRWVREPGPFLVNDLKLSNEIL